jgi:hypothetical protein
MVRSPGFGSIDRDIRPVQTCFRYGSSLKSFNQATTYKSPAHSSTGTRSGLNPSHCLYAYGFMFYFTPRRGFFSPFPHGTVSLSVTQEYLALRGGPRRFTRDFTCPMLLGIFKERKRFLVTGLSPSMVQYSAVSPNFFYFRNLRVPQPR